MTRETAVNIKNLLNGIAALIQDGRKRTMMTLDGDEKVICEIRLSLPLSSKEGLERMADEIEKEFL